MEVGVHSTGCRLTGEIPCCLTTMTLASGGESDPLACGPTPRLSVHFSSSAVTPAGSVLKSRGDTVVQLKR